MVDEHKKELILKYGNHFRSMNRIRRENLKYKNEMKGIKRDKKI